MSFDVRGGLMKSGSISFIDMAISLFLIVLLALPVPVRSQENDSTPAFTKEQLAQILAPIALYPDDLLSQVLMASTYPIEVIEADRWVKKNPGLKGEKLDKALLAQDWDPSVKSLCHFPVVLAQMSDRIGETTNIGNAFLAQQKEVMDTVQELRARAYQQGNLKSSPEQKVVVEKETIIIEPANPQVVYVPYYNPFYVYGPWWYPAYPPYYWGPIGVSLGVGISYWPGLYFGFGFGFWSTCDWRRHSIYINGHHRPPYVRHGRWRTAPGRWHHAPRHRRGVAYRDIHTARRYGQSPKRFRNFDRGVRGFPQHRNRARVDPSHRPGRPAPGRQRQGGVDRAGPHRQQPGQARPHRQQPGQARPYRQQPGQAWPYRQQQGQARPHRQQPGQARPYRQQQGQARPYRQQPGQARPYRQQPGRVSPSWRQPGQARPSARQPGPARSFGRQPGPTRSFGRQPGPARSFGRQPPGPARSFGRHSRQERQMPERADRNVFNRVDEGGKEHAASRRGRFSRKGSEKVNTRTQRSSTREDQHRGPDGA
jgi:hypothetical protein